MTIVAEHVLLDAFLIGFKFTGDGLKTASFSFMEQALMKMAQNSARNKMFGRCIARWTQSSGFMSSFGISALLSSQFVGSVITFIPKT